MSGKVTDQTKRKWFIFLIFAPGVFFIVFWLATTQANDQATRHSVELPDQYVLLGDRVEVKGEHYQVLGGKNIFTDTVDLSNNTAVAEPGRVFVGLVLVTEAVMNKTDVQLIDALGGTYYPLDVDNAVVVSNFNLPDSEGYPYMFKVNASPDYYFIQLNGNERLTWRFDNSYQK